MSIPFTALELAQVESVHTAEQWKAYTEKVKAARGGQYPSDWWELMKRSGTMDRILARFGETSDLKVNKVPGSQAVPPPFVTQIGHYDPAPLLALSNDTKLGIARRHVRHYTEQLEAGNAGDRTVRVSETELYLRTWEAGLAALETGNPLPDDCADEMIEGIDSGDMDDLLTPSELAKWQEASEVIE